MPVRMAAATELVRHVQTHGVLLSLGERADLYGLWGKVDDPVFKANLAAVVGSTQRNPARASDGIFLYNPPPPVSTAPPPPALPFPASPSPALPFPAPPLPAPPVQPGNPNPLPPASRLPNRGNPPGGLLPGNVRP